MKRGVLITGPESSGKSYLAQKLATHYNVPVVKEYARQYLATKSGYNQADLTLIAKGQMLNEQKVTNQLFFADTGVEVIHIWSQEKYGDILPELQRMLSFKQYRLVLLCRPNIPWEPDPLREYPLQRDYLFTLYQNFLGAHHIPYKVIDAELNHRVDQAVSLVDASLTSQNQKP